MPSLGAACHELRIIDRSVTWRIMYHVHPEAIVILDVFAKKTTATPKAVIVDCQKRLADFLRVMHNQKGARHARR